MTACEAKRDRHSHAVDMSTSVVSVVSSRYRLGRAANDNPAPDRAAQIVIAIGQASAAVASFSGIVAALLFLGR
ncbi:hypothetical protein GOFOIKOB_4011 [Methylobacterium tardum]|nr:hypothetical protein GOFOIKOB_4011 [Methylobacterium tardum]